MQENFGLIFRTLYKLDLAERKYFSIFCFQMLVAANFLAHFLCNSHLSFRGDIQTGPLTRGYLTSIVMLVLSTTWANLSQIEDTINFRQIDKILN